MTRPFEGFAEWAVNYSDEWYTPRWVFEALGEFDLDPCSPLRRPFDTAARHLTIAEDGLSAPWKGRIWLNPPYSEVERWIAKMPRHGAGTALVFARVETGYWQDAIWPTASALLFPRGRLTFIKGVPDYRCPSCGHEWCDEGGTAAAPSAFIAWGDADADRLKRSGIAGAFVELRS